MSAPLSREYEPRTIPGLLESRAIRGPKDAAVSASQYGVYRTLTFADLRRESDRIAAALMKRGLGGTGRGIAWALDNSDGLRALVLYHAVLRTGAYNVPINSRLSMTEITGLVSHSQALACVASPALLAQAGEAVHGIDIDALFASDVDAVSEWPVVSENDLAVVLYTSGTTGLPKGVEHTHGSSIAAGIGWADAFRLTADDVIQSPFPVVSGAALHFNALSCLWAGAHFVLDENSLPESLARIEGYASTIFVAVPSIYQYWLASGQLDSYDLGSLRLLDYGGAAMAESVIEDLAAALPKCGFMQTYGFTEAGPGGTYLSPEYARTRLGSIGSNAAGRFNRFRVVAENGREVGPGETGELQFAGPSVMRGYHRDPEATLTVMDGEWIRSGDAVLFDSEGFLYFVDRLKDIIVRGGYNISAVEIEHALVSHPDVIEAACIAAPHEMLGEVPVAAVVARPGAVLSTEILREHCAFHLADFKIPRAIHLVESLPKNAAGKVVKRALSEQLKITSLPTTTQGA